MRGWSKVLDGLTLAVLLLTGYIMWQLWQDQQPQPQVKCYIIEATYPVQQAPDSLAPPVERRLTQICFQELTQGE